MADTRKPLVVLQELITVCRDGENGYVHAAANVKDPSLQTFFRDQSLERALFAQELEQEVQRLGKVPSETSGSIGGALHRAWFDIKGDLGGGDHTILVSVEQGEDSAKKSYEEALNSSLPEEVLMVVRRQYDSVKAAHDRSRDWRDSKAA